MNLGRYAPFLDRCAAVGPRATAVAWPCSVEALGGALAAQEAGLIHARLVGPEETIRALAERHGLELGAAEFEPADSPVKAARRAVALAAAGECALILKGSLHTDELMGAVVSREGGLRTGRRVSHSFVMDAPAYPKLLHITDAVVNLAPDLAAKRDIIQNCADFAAALGTELPKAAVLSAVEFVNPVLRSTLDAAALTVMARRRQITGALVDGPLAMDLALSADAARVKGLTSPVAGDADILVAPDIETGNALFKILQQLAGATAAGVVLGAKVPVVLTSRADDARTRRVSPGVACAAAIPR